MSEPLRLTVQHAGKRKKPAKEFSIPVALALADQIFAGPCAGYTPRVPGRGVLVQRFVLPLELCKTTNALISMLKTRSSRPKNAFTAERQAKALEEKVYRMMWLQHPNVRNAPLSGRPMLRIVRFSSVEPDDAADGMKLARDLLRVPRASAWSNRHRKICGGRKGFGFLIDDAPRFVETARWWERVPPGKGFGLLEIWSNE